MNTKTLIWLQTIADSLPSIGDSRFPQYRALTANQCRELGITKDYEGNPVKFNETRKYNIFTGYKSIDHFKVLKTEFKKGGKAAVEVYKKLVNDIYAKQSIEQAQAQDKSLHQKEKEAYEKVLQIQREKKFGGRNR